MEIDEARLAAMQKMMEFLEWSRVFEERLRRCPELLEAVMEVQNA